VSADGVGRLAGVAGGRAVPDEQTRLIDAAVARLAGWRHTFSEAEALSAVWEAGYEVAPQSDPRFCLAREADGKHPRQWRLAEHILANEQLLDALNTGGWDGRDLDAQLAHLDARDGGHHVYCPVDPRFVQRADGTLEPAERERPVGLPGTTRAALDALCPALLDRWQTAGGEPWTVRQVTEMLGELGWAEAAARESWLLVRAWLRERSDIERVGLDYWVPAQSLPERPKRERLQVLPVRGPAVADAPPASEEVTVTLNSTEAVDITPPAETVPLRTDDPVASAGRWVVPLRTIHLVEGFLPVPKSVRAIYPVRGPGEGETTALRGVWFSTGDKLWLWLDRAHDRLYGPALADQLAWCEAGDLLHVKWTGDNILLRVAGHDAAVQEEEARLVDVEALAALRGGRGESYRRSLQAILQAAPEGLSFPDAVAALRERQAHAVHAGTVRAVLRAGGFVQRDGRWFAAPQPELAARRLRAATIAATARHPVSPDASEANRGEQTSALAQVIRVRLAELVTLLAGRPREG
jgi:hypothetical protein